MLTTLRARAHSASEVPIFMHDLDALYRQLERELSRPLTPEEKRLLALGERHIEVIPLRRRADDREPSDV